MPRFLIVLNDLRMGGSERQALHLARGLSDSGCEAAVMGFSPPGPVSDACRDAGIRCRSIPLPFPWSRWHTPFYLIRAAASFRREGADIILPFTSIPNAYACLLYRMAGAKACVWNQRDEGIGRPFRWMESASAARASGFIANSAASARFLTGTLNVLPDRVAVVPNIVSVTPPATTPGTWRNRLGIAHGDTVACMVGNIRPPKDHECLLRAWRIAVDRLGERGNTLHLLLVGREDHPAPVDAAIADLGISALVHRLGAQSDIPGILADCDFACFASRSEGSPNSVLEAMGAGLAVAATDLPALREIMPPEQAAYIAAKGDAATLAGHIVRLATDRAEAGRIGGINRSHVATAFAPHAVLKRYFATLRAFGAEGLPDSP
jgi:glycosyltransferase involved in cell wall biosynthesis